MPTEYHPHDHDKTPLDELRSRGCLHDHLYLGYFQILPSDFPPGSFLDSSGNPCDLSVAVRLANKSRWKAYLAARKRTLGLTH